MNTDWWALEVVEPVYDIECPQPFCERHFRRRSKAHAHLRQDHGLPWGIATKKLEAGA